MKSFENINILIKAKLFCLKNLFFLEKNIFLKKKFENFFIFYFKYDLGASNVITFIGNPDVS